MSDSSLWAQIIFFFVLGSRSFSFFSFQVEKTHCLILENMKAYPFIFLENLCLNFSGSSFGQFYVSIFIHSPLLPLSFPVNQLPTLVKCFFEVKHGTWCDLFQKVFSRSILLSASRNGSWLPSFLGLRESCLFFDHWVFSQLENGRRGEM